MDRILLIDDEPTILHLLEEILSESFPTAELVMYTTVPSEHEIKTIIAQQDHFWFGLIDGQITNAEHRNPSGLDLIQSLRTQGMRCPLIIHTANQTIGKQWRRYGAHGYIPKPVPPPHDIIQHIKFILGI